MLVQAVVVTNRRAAALDDLARRFETRPGLVPEIPYVLVGSVEQIATDLQERRERYGVSYVAVFEPGMAALAPVVARLAGQ